MLPRADTGSRANKPSRNGRGHITWVSADTTSARRQPGPATRLTPGQSLRARAGAPGRGRQPPADLKAHHHETCHSLIAYELLIEWIPYHNRFLFWPLYAQPRGLP